MKGWLRYLKLQAGGNRPERRPVRLRPRRALRAITFGFIVFAAFIWLAEQYGPLPAALVVGGFPARHDRRAGLLRAVAPPTAERAKLELAARRPSPWLDPRLLGVGMQIQPQHRRAQAYSAAVYWLFAAALGMQALGRDR